MMDLKKISKIIIPYILITLIGLLLLHNIFSPGLMTYSDHIPHYVEAYYLKYFLLANGDISGWYPYVFGGIPLYTYIPVFGHYLLILISFLVGMELAYKIIVLLSFIGPSLAIFNFLRPRFKTIPSFLVSVPLIFIDSWQGSILTGLWSTGLAITFLIIFINFSLKIKKFDIKNTLFLSIILSIIILSHTVIGIVALIFIFCRIISEYKNFKKLLIYYSILIFSSFALIAYYIFPIIDTNKWADTPRNTLIGFGNSIIEIIITEIGQLFALKQHLSPLLDIIHFRFIEGFPNLFFSITKNLPVLTLDFLAIIGIFLIIKNKKYKNLEIRVLLIFFTSLIFLASNIWTILIMSSI